MPRITKAEKEFLKEEKTLEVRWKGPRCGGCGSPTRPEDDGSLSWMPAACGQGRCPTCCEDSCFHDEGPRAPLTPSAK